jgi:pimeloyl-ACP methyl ester carboxylesterase
MFSITRMQIHSQISIMHQILLAGGPVCYRRAGQGPPLLLLHGWGGSSRYWQSTLDALAGVRHMYAPDLPGFGMSPPLSEAAGAERLARLVIEFADALGIDQFDLNGHSFSSSVAVFVAHGRPHRVRRLILTCSSTYRDERERRFVQRVHRVLALPIMLRRPWMERQRLIYRMLARRFFYRVPNDNALLQEHFADFLRMDRRTALESAASAGDPVYNTMLPQVTTPTLIIGARQDAIMPTAGTPVLARLIPNAHLTWLEECGHLPMIEQPVAYNQLLCDFLEDVM